MKQFISSRIALLKLMAVVIGVLMMIFSMSDAVAIWKNDIGKIYEKGRDDYEEGQLVEGKINYVIDTVATLETSRTVYGIPVKKELTPYYLCMIPYDDKTGKEGYLILVHATDKESINKLNGLTVSTGIALQYSGEELKSSSTPLSMELKTRTIPDEVMDYTMQYLKASGISEAEAGNMLSVYMLDEMDYGTAKFYPLFGLIIALIPIVLYIVSKRRAHAYKSSRTHYVTPDTRDDYNTAPVRREGASTAPMKRYSAEAYEQHTYGDSAPQQYPSSARGTPQKPNRRYDPSAYSNGAGSYQPGEMDSIDTTDLKL